MILVESLLRGVLRSYRDLWNVARAGTFPSTTLSFTNFCIDSDAAYLLISYMSTE
jgi:hypothetical protein